MKRAGMIRSVGAAVIIFTVAFVAGCSSDEPLSKNEYVNSWILANMKFYYLWNDEIPKSPNKSKDPELFFESLLSDEDRFSWIQDNYEELLNSLQGVNKEAGYEYKLYRESASNENVIAQIMYIKEGSPADLGNVLMRGDVITHINGELMTLTNYQSLLGQISENHNVRYKRNDGSGVFADMGTVSLTTTVYAENPNFYHNVYEVSGKKIGYYIYNFFSPGTSASPQLYNTEMENIFSEFQTAGITDLVVDLRYNSGGAEAATIRLASLIGTGVNSTKVFTRREYNDELEAEIIKEVGADFFTKKFEDKAQNVGNLISGKVYVLTSSRTASASELLINGLRPYMNVVIIGDTTVGKNVGSTSLYAEDDPKNTWGMQPIIAKSYNSLNQSDYSEGFLPNVANKDNSLIIRQLGDLEENLLSKAVAQITGAGARVDAEAKKSERESLGTSADFKKGSFNLLLDDDRIQKLMQEKLP